MKKLILFLALVIITSGFHGYSTETIDVKEGTTYSTLKDAYDKIETYGNNPVTETFYILLEGNVMFQENTTNNLEWTISGTSTHKIYIKSKDPSNRATLVRSSNDTDKNSYLLTLKKVEYIIIENIDFSDAANAIGLAKSEYCEIKNCRFYIGDFTPIMGNAPITLEHDNVNDMDPAQSKFNTVADNTIVFDINYSGTLADTIWKYFHGIYLAHAGNNKILRNLIYNAPGGAIHSYHNYTTNNIIEGNEIYRCYNHGTDRDREKNGVILAGKFYLTGNVVRYNKVWGNSMINWDQYTYKDYRGYVHPYTINNDLVINKDFYTQSTFVDNYVSYNNDNPDDKVFSLPNDEYYIVKGKTIFKKKSGNTLGNQTFSGKITDIEYANGYSIIGFDNGRILKIMGTGFFGNTMFNVRETSYGFENIPGGIQYYVGSHKFWSGITDITYVAGYTFVSFINKKVLKINGTGGGGYNVFAIQETYSGFNGISGYNYYVGDAKFTYRYVKNIKFDNTNTFLTFSNNKVLEVTGAGGGGPNMFIVRDLYYYPYFEGYPSGYTSYMVAVHDIGCSGWFVLKGAKYIPSWKSGGSKKSKQYNNTGNPISYPNSEKIPNQEWDSDIFTLYPNPSNRELTILFRPEYEKCIKVHIFNLQGIEIYAAKDISSTLNIDLSNYPSGIYIVKVEINDKLFTKKLIVQ